MWQIQIIMMLDISLGFLCYQDFQSEGKLGKSLGDFVEVHRNFASLIVLQSPSDWKVGQFIVYVSQGLK